MIHFEFIHKNVLFVQNVKKGILYTCIFWGLYGIFTKSFRFPFDIQVDMMLGQHCNLKYFHFTLSMRLSFGQLNDLKITFFTGKAYLYIASHRYIVTLLRENECIKRKFMVYIHMLWVLCMSISIYQFRDTSLKFYFSDWQWNWLEKAGIFVEYR